MMNHDEHKSRLHVSLHVVLNSDFRAALHFDDLVNMMNDAANEREFSIDVSDAMSATHWWDFVNEIEFREYTSADENAPCRVRCVDVEPMTIVWVDFKFPAHARLDDFESYADLGGLECMRIAREFVMNHDILNCDFLKMHFVFAVDQEIES